MLWIMQRGAAAAAAMLFCVFILGEAEAGRVFVSGQGSDGNPCTVALPCRSFATAVPAAGAGGEVVVLNSAGYGPVSITQSVTITNPGGVEAGVSANPGGSAILIGGSSNITVTLRGLTIEGAGSGAFGIAVVSTLPNTSAIEGTLNIADCVIKDFTQAGIAIDASSVGGSSPIMNVLVTNTLSLDNGATGVDFNAQGVIVRPTVFHSVFSGNGTGAMFRGNASLVGLFVDSHADNNVTSGILVNSLATVTLKKSTANTNGASLADDITVSGGQANLYDDNTLGDIIFINSGTGFTDGTNNIVAGGNVLTKNVPQ
jgi:hypothetical protein